MRDRFQSCDYWPITSIQFNRALLACLHCQSKSQYQTWSYGSKIWIWLHLKWIFSYQISKVTVIIIKCLWNLFKLQSPTYNTNKQSACLASPRSSCCIQFLIFRGIRKEPPPPASDWPTNFRFYDAHGGEVCGSDANTSF